MDWLPNLLNQLVTVSNAVSSITSLLGFITLLATLLGYLITNRDGGFGPKYNKEVRYQRFYKLVGDVLPARDKSLTPLNADPSGAFATYQSSSHLRYRIHFVPEGRLGVYLYLTFPDAKALADGLRQNETRIRKQLGLDQRPGLLRRLFHRTKQTAELRWESIKQSRGRVACRVTLYYPDDVRITSSGRKLKRVRRWAVDHLVAFQQVFDEQVPEVRSQLKKSQSASVPVDAVGLLVAVGQ